MLTVRLYGANGDEKVYETKGPVSYENGCVTFPCHSEGAGSLAVNEGTVFVLNERGMSVAKYSFTRKDHGNG